MNRIVQSAIATISFCCTPAAMAHADDCYDLKVKATVLEQIPSPAPQPDDPNSILLQWPWFIDLRIERIIEGSGEVEMVTALSVQHTSVLWFGERVWHLRRNSVGTYNIVWPENDPDNQAPPWGLCGETALPDRSYLTPAEGQSLADIRAAGLKRYGSWAERYADEIK